MTAIDDATKFEQHAKFVVGVRSIINIILFFFVFALGATQIGLVADLFQKYGNLPELYPSHEIKYTLGLILFNGLLSLLIALGSYFAPMFFFLVILFSNMTMWIVSAGVLNHTEPYRAGNCGSTFAAPFDAFVGDCKIYASLEAISWTLWVITLILTINLFLDTFVLKAKKHTVYGA